MPSWKQSVKIALLQPSKISQLRTGLKKFNQGKVRILMYHRVTNELGRSDAPYNAVSIDNFDKQMARLASEYSVITLDDLCLCFPDLTVLPENSGIITFVDGFLDNYVNTFPF